MLWVHPIIIITLSLIQKFSSNLKFNFVYPKISTKLALKPINISVVAPTEFIHNCNFYYYYLNWLKITIATCFLIFMKYTLCSQFCKRTQNYIKLFQLYLYFSINNNSLNISQTSVAKEYLKSMVPQENYHTVS